MIVPRTLLVAFVAMGVTLTAGCGGSKGTQVSGTLMKNDKPYIPPENGAASIQFVPMATDGKMRPGTGQADPKTGAFTLQGAVPKEGLVPGKYKVVVLGVVSGQYGKDLFDNAFSPEKTPLTYEVTTDANQQIIIDLGKKTVTKQ